MAKKADRSELKKECPSCGLGVAEKANICEFCGWDFEEEDEWILQIEKLERDLMLEKQKYEPGTVNHMIESTLRSTMAQRVEPSTPADEKAMEVEEPPAVAKEPEEPMAEDVFEEEQAPEPKVRRVRSVAPQPQPTAVEEPEPVVEAAAPPEPAAPKVRRVRTVKTSPQSASEPSQRALRTATVETEPGPREAPMRRTRVVRKVKK